MRKSSVVVLGLVVMLILVGCGVMYWRVNGETATHLNCRDCLVPIPPGSVVGPPNSMNNDELNFSVPMSVDQVVDFYAAKAAAAGWEWSQYPAEPAYYLLDMHNQLFSMSVKPYGTTAQPNSIVAIIPWEPYFVTNIVTPTVTP